MMTTSNPAPDRTRCPICMAGLSSPICSVCGTELNGPAGQELWSIDQELHRLGLRRTDLVQQLTSPSTTSTFPTTPPSMASGPSFSPSAPPETLPAPATTLPGWAASPAGPLAQRPPPPAGLPPLMAPGGPPPGLGSETNVSSLLLGLGVSLLVVAAIIFAAVSWNRLGALGQGALLVGLTVLTAAATRLAARRRLTGTAEALGVLTVVLGPLVAQAVRITIDLPSIEDRSWATWANWGWWPAALMVIGGVALSFGQWVKVRSPQYLGVVLLQVGPPIWVALAPVHPGIAVALLAAQGTIVAIGPAWQERSHPRGALWKAGATMALVVALFVGFLQAAAANGASVDQLGSVLALSVVAAACAVVAWHWRLVPAAADPATIGAALALSVAIGRALAGVVPDLLWWPIMGLVAAAGLLAAQELAGPRRASMRAVSWLVASVAALPVLGAAMVALEAMLSTDAAWHQMADGQVRLAGFALAPEPVWAAALLGLLAVGASVAVEVWRRPRRVATAVAVGLLSFGSLVLPPLLELSLATVTAMALSTAAILGSLSWQARRPQVPLLAAAAAVGVAGAWSIGPISLEMMVVGAALVLGSVAVLRGLDVKDATLAGAGAALAAAAVVVESGLVTFALTDDLGWAWMASAITAAAVGAVLPVSGLVGAATSATSTSAGTGESREAGRVALASGGSVLLVAHLVAVLAIEPATVGSAGVALTAALSVGAVALATVALTIRSSVATWWVWAVAAAAEGLVLVWLRLAEASVVTPEAYTLPVALVLGLSAWLVAHDQGGPLERVRSWSLEGPAAAMAVGPTVLIALGDPGVLRQLVGLAAGAVLLVAGAAWRRRAPIDVGAAAVVLVGLQGLLPYAAEVPRWVSFGVVGAVLVLVGATFEQRRRDLRQARRRYAALR